MLDTRPVRPDLQTLIHLFYADGERLGQFTEMTSEQLPATARSLLAHEKHMTVTVEAFHHSPVDVEVLETNVTPRHYARKILLRRQSDGGVVQFGIMRIDLSVLNEKTRREIESEKTPLGRVLIQNQVLREIHLDSLWKIEPGSDLQELFGISPAQTVYGRTALIDCNGHPAVELIEIVTPER
ncbi:MAG TPA: hypothetical protein VFE24_08085 [Pirellulales bacterium]|jgi:chorismate-pyruvate lyase|nr:hypothetical protein [Pirellulales bacterium]